MSARILLIEDSPTDAAILLAAFEEIGYGDDVQIAQSGLAAIEILNGIDSGDRIHWPQLILLDLNLPHRSGLDILADIKTNPDWAWIPTVVLSSSSSPNDISRSYQRHANAYISKPRQLAHYEKMAQQLCSFWFQTAQTATG